MAILEFDLQISSLRPSLFSFTKRFTNDRDESLDLVQDTILKALLYKEKFRDDTNLKGWLFTIMRNTFINNYRKEKRSRRLHDYTKELYFLNTEDTHTFNRPASNVEYQDMWEQIHTLPQELLVPFKMHEAGYRYHEIAEQQNIPLGTVKNRIHQARKEIQRKLTGFQRS